MHCTYNYVGMHDNYTDITDNALADRLTPALLAICIRSSHSSPGICSLILSMRLFSSLQAFMVPCTCHKSEYKSQCERKWLAKSQRSIFEGSTVWFLCLAHQTVQFTGGAGSTPYAIGIEHGVRRLDAYLLQGNTQHLWCHLGYLSEEGACR